MKVLVTGATGLVGCHSVAALLRAGHDLRLLVRNPEKAAGVLAPFCVSAPELAHGDVGDPTAVEAALEGCDAVLHGAALFCFDTRRRAEMERTNVEGTRLVLETAHARGLDPIVHVSSVASLFPPDGDRLTVDTRVKSPRDDYARTKAAAERIARRLQARGAPVVIVYPGGIWGPHDPAQNEGVRVILDQVRSGVYLTLPGGQPMVDVRDLAALHAALMQPGRGPRRYMLGGHFVTHAELASTFARITGRRILQVPVPGALMRGFGALGDLVQRVGIDPHAITYESMLIATTAVPTDDSETLRELGLRLRPIEETLRDTLVWMHAQGLLSTAHAGLLAGASQPTAT